VGQEHLTVANSGTEDVKLNAWRWLKLRDQYSLQELPVRIHLNSQPVRRRPSRPFWRPFVFDWDLPRKRLLLPRKIETEPTPFRID
jgi:hypothetical protein